MIKSAFLLFFTFVGPVLLILFLVHSCESKLPKQGPFDHIIRKAEFCKKDCLPYKALSFSENGACQCEMPK